MENDNLLTNTLIYIETLIFENQVGKEDLKN
jgi:hypothetical protein